MLAVASTEPAVVFPEGAALAAGIWVLGHEYWGASPWRLAVVTAVAAAGGVAVASVGLPAWQAELVALTGTLGLLLVTRSRLAPVVSAGMIPSVFEIHSWAYPIGVLVVCSGMAVGVVLRARWRAARSSAGCAGTAGRTDPAAAWPATRLAAAWMLGAGWVALAGVIGGLPVGVVAPPMFVAMLEAVAGNRAVRAGIGALGQLSARWASLVVGVGVGAAIVATVGRGWVGSGLLVAAVAAMVVALRTLRLAHPPAVALILVPLLVNPLAPAALVGGVAIGAAVLVAGGWLAARALGVAGADRELSVGHDPG